LDDYLFLTKSFLYHPCESYIHYDYTVTSEEERFAQSLNDL
jgi:hypothetical protein